MGRIWPPGWSLPIPGLDIVFSGFHTVLIFHTTKKNLPAISVHSCSLRCTKINRPVFRIKICRMLNVVQSRGEIWCKIPNLFQSIVTKFFLSFQFSQSCQVHKFRFWFLFECFLVSCCLNIQQLYCSLKQGSIPGIPAALMIKSAAKRKQNCNRGDAI